MYSAHARNKPLMPIAVLSVMTTPKIGNHVDLSAYKGLLCFTCALTVSLKGAGNYLP
jgi:hypothetical protein